MKKSIYMAFAGLVILASACFTSCSKDYGSSTYTNPTPTTSMYTLSGNGSGSQVVPVVAGSGTSTFSGTYNGSTGVMSYTTTWVNLSGNPTSGSFYYGASGSNGAVIGTPWTFPTPTGTTAAGSGSLSGSMTLNATQAAELIGGTVYYILGTAANASGEVRGQITASVQ